MLLKIDFLINTQKFYFVKNKGFFDLCEKVVFLPVRKSTPTLCVKCLFSKFSILKATEIWLLFNNKKITDTPLRVCF